MRYLIALGALFLACSGNQAPQTSSAATDAACKRAMADLQGMKAAGVSCLDAKQSVKDREPGCPLSFSCPAEQDAGGQ